MNLIDKAFLLKKTKFFGALDLDLLLTIADKMELGIYQPGSKVFLKGLDANQMYLIATGTVKINDAQGDELALLQAGQFFGDEAIFNERPRAYEAVCSSETSVLTLSRSHLLAIINECPSVAISLLEAYTENIQFRQR